MPETAVRFDARDVETEHGELGRPPTDERVGNRSHT